MLKRWRNCCCGWASRKFVKKETMLFYRHADGRTTTIPHHKARMLARPLIREILREIEITIDDYNNHIKKYK